MKKNDDSDKTAAFNADDRVDVIVKFDTACSRSMSGVNDRIEPDILIQKSIYPTLRREYWQRC